MMQEDITDRDGIILKRLTEQRVAIVTHALFEGAPQVLRDFLLDKCEILAFIGHPFHYSKENQSFLELFQRGNLTRRRVSWPIRGHEVVFYIRDVIATIYFIAETGERYDLYFGVDPLNALAGILLRKVGLVKRVIFYTIDYSPTRFKNRLLNAIYHMIDSFCAIHSDQLWNLSPEITKARQEKGVKRDRNAQLVVPIGVHPKEMTLLPIKELKKNTVAYVGGLYGDFGFELVIEAFPQIVREIPDIKIKVISFDPFPEEWWERIVEEGMQTNFEVLGYIRDDEVVKQILAKCRLGIAPYRDSLTTFKKYTDVTKPKTYMACGLPVVITRVPPIATEIEKAEAGIVVNDNAVELASAVICLLTDTELHRKCRENAVRLVARYTWDEIFTEALTRTLDDKVVINNEVPKTSSIL